MREKTYHLYLNEEERSRVIQSLIELKNNLAAQGRYTDAVDDVLCKVLEAKKKKLKIEYMLAIYPSANSIRSASISKLLDNS